ncbi:bifunctional riboflavin kinase/FAD synthetase [Microbacterium indicum]|uniref:bifunctional riboflavin kinase/FAD synthetase n=1 Tax=Microbacterium indicum TaxID=358100 RepID=UPI00041C71E4|nr:bifunctional riboflavin kinase/FAD synthetase [Microbacterium indicum]
MIVFRSADEVPEGFGPSVVAIGKFDGVHAGHRAIIERALVDAATGHARTVAVTFDRNPLATIAPEHCPPVVVGVDQKLDLLAATGVDATLMLAFDEALAAVPAEQFVEDYLVRALGTTRVLVGADFRFGNGGAGDVAFLRAAGERHGFSVEVVADVASVPSGDGEGRRVSSTWIRELLAAGDVDRAAKLLGHPHAMRGEVVHGLRRGRELGFPTANLSRDATGFVPADGVYAGWLVIRRRDGELGSGARYPAAISVGTNPTFDDVPERVVEAHVIDRTGLDLYGQTVDVEFVSRIRGMVAFEGVEKLTAQIAADVDAARAALTP